MSLTAAYVVPHPPIAVPEVGKGEEKKITATLDSFRKVAEDIAEQKPDTILVLSPHSVMYSNYFHISPGERAAGDMGRFGASDVAIDVEYDTALVSEICQDTSKIDFPAGTEGERDSDLDHGTLVPLSFLAEKYTNFKLVRIGLSGLSLQTHFDFGKILKTVCDRRNEKIVLIASGDLSHCQKADGPYGFRPEGPKYDESVMNIFRSGDLSKLLSFDLSFLEKAMECGHRSFCIMAGALDGVQIKVTPLSHEATFGVGYGFAILKPS